MFRISIRKLVLTSVLTLAATGFTLAAHAGASAATHHSPTQYFSWTGMSFFMGSGGDQNCRTRCDDQEATAR